jgi:hypothetical protein
MSLSRTKAYFVGKTASKDFLVPLNADAWSTIQKKIKKKKGFLLQSSQPKECRSSLVFDPVSKKESKGPGERLCFLDEVV